MDAKLPDVVIIGHNERMQEASSSGAEPSKSATAARVSRNIKMFDRVFASSHCRTTTIFLSVIYVVRTHEDPHFETLALPICSS
eukprot:1194864-Prorocentrum_minimum.AAC.2